MTQYIDKSAVVAEIKRIMAEEMSFFEDCCKVELENSSSPAVYTRMEMLLSFLDTLDVKEVDEEYNGKAMLHVLTKGVEQGKMEILDKACEWLKKNHKNYSSNALGEEYLINDFKKAMKGE